MKKLLLILLFPFAAFAQEPPLESFEAVQKGYWQVTVDGDTLPDQFNRFDTAWSWAREVAETFASSDRLPDIAIVAPRWAVDYRFNYQYTDTLKVPVYDKPEAVRKFSPTISRPNPDTTDTYTIIINGESDAESVSIAYTCYDQRGRHNGGGPAERVSGLWVWERELDCNTILTYWVTADEQVGVYFVDVAHQRAIGQ